MDKNKRFSTLEIKLVFFLIFSVSMYFFSLDLYAPTLPMVKQLFQESYPRVQWTITLFTLGFCTSQLIFGALISHFDKRLILLITSTAFCSISLAAISTTSLDTLYYYRFTQGVCCAAMYVIGFATVRELSSEHRLKILMPLSSLGFTLMSAFSPIIGGLLAYYYEWNQVFSAMLAFGLILVVATYFLFPRTSKNAAITRKTPIKKGVIKDALSNYKTMIMNPIFTVSSFISISAVVAMVIFYQIASFIFIDKTGTTPLVFGGICFLLIMVSVFARVYYLSYLKNTCPISGLFKWSGCAIFASLLAFISSYFQGLSFVISFTLSYALFAFALSTVHCYALVFAFTEADPSQSGYSAAIYGTLTSSYIVIGSVIAAEYEPSVNYLILLMAVMGIICLSGARYIQRKSQLFIKEEKTPPL